MSAHNITVSAGSTVRLPTAGKYCDRDIVIKAQGDGACEILGSHAICYHPTNYIPDEDVKIYCSDGTYAKFLDEMKDPYLGGVEYILFKTDGNIIIKGEGARLEYDGSDWSCIYVDGEDVYTYPMPPMWAVIIFYLPLEVSQKEFELLKKLFYDEEFSAYDIGCEIGFEEGYGANREILAELMEWDLEVNSSVTLVYIFNKHPTKYLITDVVFLKSLPNGDEETEEFSLTISPDDYDVVEIWNASGQLNSVEFKKVRFSEDGT